MKRENTEKGSVTIEAAIILPIFCALFMALNGFFFVFNAQNQIAHALVQSATSLGMDSYANNQLASGLPHSRRLQKILFQQILFQPQRLVCGKKERHGCRPGYGK